MLGRSLLFDFPGGKMDASYHCAVHFGAWFGWVGCMLLELCGDGVSLLVQGE